MVHLLSTGIHLQFLNGTERPIYVPVASRYLAIGLA